MKRFQCGLVVGKFSPLHRGHEQLIQCALEACEQVVLLSYSNPEFPGCTAENRAHWLRVRFPNARALVVSDQLLQSWPELRVRWPRLPENDAPAELHRAFCADLCTDALGVIVDAVYSSENYGAGFAKFLSADHQRRGFDRTEVASIVVDLGRRLHPISGTALRNDSTLLREWTAPEVYASFVQRICFLGGESSGKSTLAQQLATHFETKFAAEYGRERWEQKSGNLAFDDLLEIAREQIAREENLARSANRFVFCDTSPLTTLNYSLDLFGRSAPELVELSHRPYDLTVLCAPDFPFVQDGTRRDAKFRETQHARYLQQLTERRVPFHIVDGPLAHRVATVTRLLQNPPTAKD